MVGANRYQIQILNPGLRMLQMISEHNLFQYDVVREQTKRKLIDM